MVTFRFIASAVALVLMSACGSASDRQAALSPSPLPSPAASPVLVTYTTTPPTVKLVSLDGTVIATVPGYPVGDEIAVGAYVVMESETGGIERVVDAAGVIKTVAPEAAKLMTPTSASLVLDSTTAIIGCFQTPAERQANGPCTAEEVNMTTGSVRQLLSAPGTGNAAMSLGVSLTVLGVSLDGDTVWLREVSAASGGQLDIVGVNRQSGAVTTRLRLLNSLINSALAVSRDGKYVAGQEDFGTDADHVLIRHLHVVAIATGLDTDVQGAALYVAGMRPPGILFSPDGAMVAWWGALNSGPPGQRLNIAALGGAGKTLWPQDPGDAGTDIAAFWLDPGRLLMQDGSGAALLIDPRTGAVTPLPNINSYITSVIA